METEGLVQRDRRTSALRADAGTAAMSRPLRSALDVLTRTERITMAEILDLRLTVEARAAERAAEVATAGELADLETALEAMRQPGLTGQEWDERALAFHVTMVSASHNEAFVLIMVAAREAAAGILERALREAASGGEEVAGPDRRRRPHQVRMAGGPVRSPQRDVRGDPGPPLPRRPRQPLALVDVVLIVLPTAGRRSRREPARLAPLHASRPGGYDAEPAAGDQGPLTVNRAQSAFLSLRATWSTTSV